MLQEHILHFISLYGYIGIFLALVLGIIGLPIPDEVLLTFAGFLVFKGELHFIGVIVSAFLGSAIGITLSYIIGYKLGMPFIKKYGKYIYLKESYFIKAEKWFDRYGIYTTMFSYFIPGIRHINAYYIGIMKKPYIKFGIYAYLGGIIWVTTFTGLGFLVGEKWSLWMHYIHEIITILMVVLVIGGITFWYKRRFKKLKNI